MALIEATRARAHDPARATDNGEFAPCTAHPVVTPARLAELEHRFGRPLPDLLRQLYTEVGNGGYGPGYGLCGAQDVAERSLAWLEMYGEPPERQLLPFVDWGCTVYSVLELETGRVGVLDLTAVYDGPSFTASAYWQYDSVETYWQAWLDGAELFFPVEEES